MPSGCDAVLPLGRQSALWQFFEKVLNIIFIFLKKNNVGYSQNSLFELSNIGYCKFTWNEILSLRVPYKLFYAI